MGWQGFTSRAEKKVALLYVNTAQTDYEKTDGLASIHSRPWGRSLCTPRTQYQPIAGMVWCTASHVLNAPAPTLAKQVGPWTIAFMNSARLWKRRPRILCSCWACVLLEPSSGCIEGNGDWHPQPRLPNVPGLLVLCGHVRADCFCPAMQCLDHHKFVGQWAVGHKVGVAVHEGGFPVYSRWDGVYVHGLSEAVRWVLTPLGSRISYRPNTTLKQLLVQPKDRTPTEELAGVVYQVPRASCPASYVGQTGRCLGKRIKEPESCGVWRLHIRSALVEHAWSHHHPVDWDKVRVLEQQPRLYHRLTLESIHIRSHPHTLNRSDGTLSPVYNSLFFCSIPLLYPTYCLIPPSQLPQVYSSPVTSPAVTHTYI